MSSFSYPINSDYIMQKKRAIRKELLQKKGLINKKIAIMSGSTIGEIKNILELFLLDCGIAPTFYEGEYSLFYENLVFDDGSLAAFAPDIIYIHTSVRNIKSFPSISDSAEGVEAKLNAEYSRFEGAFKAAARFNCPVIQNNFELPPYRIMGNKSAADIHGRVNFVSRLNQKLYDYAAKQSIFYINDINYLSASIGTDNWLDNSTWYAYKYALAAKYIPHLCKSIADIIKSIFGKNHKSLVLDLDNTLWGGIIGDDGADGIVLGNETPTGMAYTEFQSYTKELAQMGVLLNVCSKNEENIALEGLSRPESVLKRDDFLCFKANWEPKHVNIANIAKELNIMPDSLVFADDNPAEREIVRTQLCDVAVPELTSPEEYIKAIDKAGFFEITSFSGDDKKRNEMYKQNIEREALQQNFGDYTDYLKSLEMYCDIGAFCKENTTRIAQLINKTNQFNLTTRRYTEAEVEQLINNSEFITIYGRLVDKFGDNGIVTAIIAHREDTVIDIDLWIMSCRTFKRHLEYAMFDELIRLCRENGITTIKARFLPTAKNLLVSDFYDTIGFKLNENLENNGKVYSYDIPPQSEKMNNVIKINNK